MATTPRKTKPAGTADAITADLVAVLVAVTDGQPKIMTIANAGALPSGPFEFAHRSLQSGLRAWVEEQTGHPLGYVEQLYTFADRGRTGDAERPHASRSAISASRARIRSARASRPHWSGWYDYFPWEDHRDGARRDDRENAGAALAQPGRNPRLHAALQRERWQRAAITFGCDGRDWNEELVLQRYELLYEAALIPEAVRDRRRLRRRWFPAVPMTADHRRILATGIARLRAKIKYRPVVFELMPPNSPCCNCNAVLRRSPAGWCTSRTSAA